MFKKIVKQFWKNKYQFIKYTLIGSSGFILDISTLLVLKEILNFTPIWSVVINQLVVVNYIFVLNKFWTFKAKGITSSQAWRFWSLMGWNYIFAILIMWIGNSLLGLNYILVRILSIAVVVTWNFWLYKYWVFVDKVISLKIIFKNFRLFLAKDSEKKTF